MIIITGATGFLGRDLAGHLLEREERPIVRAIVRGKSQAEAESRLFKIISDQLGASRFDLVKDRLQVVAGDISLENFGLGTSQFQELASECDEIFHCAASTTLEAPLREARLSNVVGTARMLDLCKERQQITNQLPKLHHVSTAFVAGKTKGIVSPDTLPSSAYFKNSYERSKAEAEQLVRTFSQSLPYTIYRPSIIVGDSKTGHTTAFNVLYVPAKFIAKGFFKGLPAIPHVPFDVVPVNYVSEAIAELSADDEIYQRSFHLCSGVGRETNPAEILELIIRTVNKYREFLGARLLQAPIFVPPEVLQLAHHSIEIAAKQIERLVTTQLKIINHLLPFIPYMTSNPQFDTSASTLKLQGKLEPAPLFRSYAERVFYYCLATNWGRRAIPAGFPSL